MRPGTGSALPAEPGHATVRLGRGKTLLFTLLFWSIGMAAAEGIARLVFLLRGEAPPSADASLAEEWRWAQEHLRAGEAVLPGLAEFDPRLGWRLRPNLRREGAQTNAAGMRANLEFPLEPAEGRRRLVLVGDSYTFGSGVHNQETFAQQLADRHLPGWDVLNLAVPGYGTDQQVLAFEHVGARYRPDVVVLGFFVRDYERNLLAFRGYQKPRFRLDGRGELRLDDAALIPPEALLDQYLRGERRVGDGARLYLLEIARGRLSDLRDRRIHSGAEGWRVLARLMQRFASGARERGAEPLFVLLPGRDRIETGDDRFGELERLCAQHARGIGLAYLSLTEPLRELERHERAFKPDGSGGHFSIAGNRVAAREIFEAMRAQGWLDRSDPAALAARQG